MEVESLNEGSAQVDRLKILYPNVREELPRNFSNLDKCSSIGLALQNLRVHYKGVGKSHNDAASVRTAFPIPASCGLYYFEVKIISKGRDGYMGIGLTAHNFKMNRLPGWDKQSYGYHGDDGNSFCSSGNGQPYGPTFTTGDIIGCGVNLVDNTCFYTKNGHHLGIAFRDLPSRLYPTVGLQTPGEIVDANFGQKQFEFDIEDMLKELRASTKAAIYSFPLPDDQGDWTVIMHKMVSSYLVHHGFSSTAEIFAKITGQTFNEDLSSIKNRQNISKLVLMGRMGQAIEQTSRSYPGLLESNQNLMFMLKCRQFVEMVNGSDEDLESGYPSTMARTVTQTSVIVAPNKQQQLNILLASSNEALSNSETQLVDNNSSSSIEENDHLCGSFGEENSFNNNVNQQQRNNNKKINAYIENHYHDCNLDVEMESANNGYKNGGSLLHRDDDIMEVDSSPASNKSVKSGIERMLEFGRELFQMSQQLQKENGTSDKNTKLLEDTFSLLAYSNPWASPLGWQLCPSRRESICSALNSAILESMNYSNRPPIEVCIAHAYDLLRLMSSSSLGSCAFVNIEDILLQQN